MVAENILNLVKTLLVCAYATLIEKYKMNPIGAFITVDWIMREPEKATKELNRGIK